MVDILFEPCPEGIKLYCNTKNGKRWCQMMFNKKLYTGTDRNSYLVDFNLGLELISVAISDSIKVERFSDAKRRHN